MTAGSQPGPETPLAGPLAGLRVLELADEKGQFCGKLMADLGADVIKVEPSGGQDTRWVGPFLDDVAHRELSLSFWHYNTSKRGITLDLESADGRSLFRRLVPSADVILETYPPGYLPSLRLGYQGLATTTRLVHEGRIDKVTAHNIVQGGKLVERTHAFMVSPGISADDIRRLGFTPFDSVQDALNEASRRKGRSARMIILGMGGEICPVAV